MHFLDDFTDYKGMLNWKFRLRSLLVWKIEYWYTTQVYEMSWPGWGIIIIISTTKPLGGVLKVI